MFQLKKQYETKGDTFDQKLTMLQASQLVKAAAAKIHPNLQPKPIASHPLVIEAIHYIESILCIISGTKDIADRLSITKDKLYDLFIKYLRVSPKNYVQVKRMAMIQLQLRNCGNFEELLNQYGFKNKDSYRVAYTQFYSNTP